MYVPIVCEVINELLFRSARHLHHQVTDLRRILSDENSRKEQQAHIDELIARYDKGRRSLLYALGNQTSRTEYEQEWVRLGHVIKSNRALGLINSNVPAQIT